jgi:hypothetical protein
MTVLLLLTLFCAWRFLQGCLSWIVALAVRGWAFRHNPFIINDIKVLIQEIASGW